MDIGKCSVEVSEKFLEKLKLRAGASNVDMRFDDCNCTGHFILLDLSLSFLLGVYGRV